MFHQLNYYKLSEVIQSWLTTTQPHLVTWKTAINVKCETLQHSWTLTLEHTNAVVTTTEMAKSLATIYVNNSAKIDILHGYTEPNSSNISFNINELCYLVIIGHDNIEQTYFLSLFCEKISGNYGDPFLKIFLLVSSSFINVRVCYHRDLNLIKLFC